jgi:tetratricopeptide (TPR) repeat protein
VKTSVACAWSAALGIALVCPRARAGACEELVRTARAHEANGEADVALRQYNEAVSLDATCENGWLGLGALRARTDAAEAERVYTAALSHVPTLAGAIAGRARTRWQLGRAEEAEDDMHRFVDAAVATDVRTALAGLVELATWYAAANRAPAQLAVWRRIASIAHATDGALEARAQTNVTALVLVVGTADPVTHPARIDLFRSVAARLRR